MNIGNMINGVWYGFEESATNKPDPTITYGAVRCVKWSNNNADIEVISMMNSAIRYINHYVDIAGWEGWKKVSTYTGTNDPSNQISALNSTVSALNNTVNSLSSTVSSHTNSISTLTTNATDIIRGRAFEFEVSIGSGNSNHSFDTPAFDGENQSNPDYVIIALKTCTLDYSTTQSHVYMQGWALSVDYSNQVWVNYYNTGATVTGTLTIIAIYCKRTAL